MTYFLWDRFDHQDDDWKKLPEGSHPSVPAHLEHPIRVILTLDVLHAGSMFGLYGVT
jgi:hypothetical protein